MSLELKINKLIFYYLTYLTLIIHVIVTVYLNNILM